MIKATLTLVLTLLLANLTLGTSFIGIHDLNYGTDVFIDVPYASPPARFHAPVPWSGDQRVILASKPSGKHCYGSGSGASTTSISEDCLTLDIIRPSNARGAIDKPVIVFADSTTPAPKKLLPIYVFFHGGDFNIGDKSEYDGRNLVKTSIALGSPMIYIGVNYRLGFLGFPSGKEAESHGGLNLGLLDSRMSLAWLQEYIKYFGGDPKKIVIGGQGSGADMVAYHLLGNGGNSDGLFRGAILHSGSATSSSPIPHANHTEWQKHYDNIVSNTGCNNSSDTWAYLQSVPVDQLMNASRKVFANAKLTSSASVFSPVIDGKFLTDFPSVLMEHGKCAHVPVLMGTTTSEIVNSVPVYNGFGSDSSIIAYLKSIYPYVSDGTLQTLLSYYSVSDYKNIGPPLSGAQWSRVVAIMNDLQIFCPANTQALQMSKVTNVFKYRFNAVLESITVRPWEGVPQGSELRYLFPIGGEDMSKQSSADSVLMARFQRSIISFITNLDPSTIRPIAMWEKFTAATQIDIVFERGNPPPTIERFTIDQSVCAFVERKNPEFLR